MIDFIDRTQEALRTHKARSTQIPELVLKILESATWQKRDPAPGKLEIKQFEYFPEFAQTVRPWGLQIDFKELEEICKGFDDAQLALAKTKSAFGKKITAEELKPVRKTERQKHLELLEVHRPDLLKKILNKELSVHQAMIDAGFKKKCAKVEKSPEGFAKYIAGNFNHEQKATLIKILLKK